MKRLYGDNKKKPIRIYTIIGLDMKTGDIVLGPYKYDGNGLYRFFLSLARDYTVSKADLIARLNEFTHGEHTYELGQHKQLAIPLYSREANPVMYLVEKTLLERQVDTNRCNERGENIYTKRQQAQLRTASLEQEIDKVRSVLALRLGHYFSNQNDMLMAQVTAHISRVVRETCVAPSTFMYHQTTKQNHTLKVTCNLEYSNPGRLQSAFTILVSPHTASLDGRIFFQDGHIQLMGEQSKSMVATLKQLKHIETTLHEFGV